MLGAGPQLLWNGGCVHLEVCVAFLLISPKSSYKWGASSSPWGGNLRLPGPAKISGGNRSELSVQDRSFLVALLSGGQTQG